MNQSYMMAGVRLIVALVALLNSVFAHYGINPIPISSDFIYQTLSDVFLLVTLVYTWKKNNDITPAGIAGTAVTKKMKNTHLNPEEQQALKVAKEELTEVPYTDTQIDVGISGNQNRKDDFIE